MFYPFLVSENSKEQISFPDTHQPDIVTQLGANLEYERAEGIRMPVLLAGSGEPGADIRQEWSTLMLRGSFYHPSTLALVSRVKVRSAISCEV